MSYKEDEKAKIAAAYVEKGGMGPAMAEAAATGYLDAVDDVMEGVYYGLYTLGPLDLTLWTTKKGHEIANKLYAGN